MEIVSQKFRQMPVSEMAEHPENPNVGDVGLISSSIETHGWYGAVIVQESTGYVLAGNHRLKAAKWQKAKKIPAIVVDVDDDLARRIMVADNGTAAAAHPDTEQLAALLTEFLDHDAGLDGLGFDSDDLDRLVEDLSTPGLDPEDRATCETCGQVLKDGAT